MENKENGDGGTTPEIHISAENKNIAFVEDKECQLFAVNSINTGMASLDGSYAAFYADSQ